MKRLFVFLFLIISWNALSQITPKYDCSVTNATTAFGVGISSGMKIYDQNTSVWYYCITATGGSSTLTTASGNFRVFVDTVNKIDTRFHISQTYEPKLPSSTDTMKYLWYNHTFHYIYYQNILGAPLIWIGGENNLWNISQGLLITGQTILLNGLKVHGDQYYYGIASWATPDSNLSLYGGQVVKMKWYLPLYAKDTNTQKNPITLKYGNDHYLGLHATADAATTVTNGMYKTDIRSIMLIQADTSMFSDSTFGRILSDGFVIDTIDFTIYSKGTASVKLAVYYGSNWTGTGTLVINSPFTTVTVQGVQTDIYTFNSATIAKGNYVWVKLKGSTLVCKFFSVQIKGHYI